MRIGVWVVLDSITQLLFFCTVNDSVWNECFLWCVELYLWQTAAGLMKLLPAPTIAMLGFLPWNHQNLFRCRRDCSKLAWNRCSIPMLILNPSISSALSLNLCTAALAAARRVCFWHNFFYLWLMVFTTILVRLLRASTPIVALKCGSQPWHIPSCHTLLCSFLRVSSSYQFAPQSLFGNMDTQERRFIYIYTVKWAF